MTPGVLSTAQFDPLNKCMRRCRWRFNSHNCFKRQNTGLIPPELTVQAGETAVKQRIPGQLSHILPPTSAFQPQNGTCQRHANWMRSNESRRIPDSQKKTWAHLNTKCLNQMRGLIVCCYFYFFCCNQRQEYHKVRTWNARKSSKNARLLFFWVGLTKVKCSTKMSSWVLLLNIQKYQKSLVVKVF